MTDPKKRQFPEGRHIPLAEFIDSLNIADMTEEEKNAQFVVTQNRTDSFKEQK